MNKVHVIINPLSARGKTGERWNAIKEVVHHHFNEYKYIFTEKPRQATDIARELLHDGFDLIIGVGGDGTLNEIANGFFKGDSQRVINEDASLGVIPSGTGSDFIRFMKIPRDFNQSVALIKNGAVKKIDVGKVSFGDGSAPKERQYFINISDFGLGAEVIKNLSAVPSGKRGALSYYKGLLSTIRSYRSQPVRIVVDDSEEIEGRFLIGAVANGRIFGGGMIIAPEAQPDDGYFDLVLVEDMKPFEIVRNSYLLYTGTLLRHPKVTRRRAKKITIQPAATDTHQNPINIEYDGELGQPAPARFQILERCLNFRF